MLALSLTLLPPSDDVADIEHTPDELAAHAADVATHRCERSETGRHVIAWHAGRYDGSRSHVVCAACAAPFRIDRHKLRAQSFVPRGGRRLPMAKSAADVHAVFAGTHAIFRGTA